LKDQIETSIDVCGVSFGVVAGARGLIRLELPPLSSAVREIEATTRPTVELRDEDAAGPFAGQLMDAGRFVAELLRGADPGAPPAVDLGGFTEFTKDVLAAVYRIPWGAVSSYGGVAGMTGNPAAARAVGGAVARNPVPLVIPCHRVLRSDGSIGGWSGHPGWKDWLLELEGSLVRTA
jgi:methylated-DNA-[protein]-cysteine S-methyltransferase